MIPLQLYMRNFICYREQSLDFRGIHLACLTGNNGHGKSAILDAITWVLWGYSRVGGTSCYRIREISRLAPGAARLPLARNDGASWSFRSSAKFLYAGIPLDLLHNRNRAADPILRLDARAQVGGALAHRRVRHRLLDRLRKPVGRQLLAGNRCRPRSQSFYTPPPKGLIAKEGA